MRALAAILLLVCGSVAGQTTLGVGALRGTVVDPSDQVVSGARVTLTETSKGLVRESTSGDDGSYFFLSVIAGRYSVKVERPGFVTEEVNAVSIDVGQQASIGFRLQIGDVHTSVTVDSPPTAELNAESNAIGSLV